MKLHRATRYVFALAAGVVPAAAQAQAFGLNEIGSCAVARGFATTASPCKDASTIFWNPAAATSLSGWNLTGGAAAIDVKGSFTQDTTFRRYDADLSTEWVPHVFLNYHNDRSKAAYGIGVYVPYGLTSQWYDNFPGRFSAKRASLKTIYVQPNFAWQLTPKWSIGGGPVFGHSTVELVQGIDLSTVPTASTAGAPTFGMLGIPLGTEFARVAVNGTSTAWGAQIGVYGKVSPEWSVGARFLSPLEFKYDDADATFTQIPTGLVVGPLPGAFAQGTGLDTLTSIRSQFTSGALVAQKVKTHITHPAQIQAGAAYSGFKNWMLEADYAWIGWKRFDVLPVEFQGPAKVNNRVLLEQYNNSSSIRLGAEYSTAKDGWKLRGGFAGVASAAPPETVTPLLPEQDRVYWTVGAGIPLMSKLVLDAAYAHVYTAGARGRIAERTTTLNTTSTAAQINSGVYNLSANIFSFTLKASY